MDRSRPKDHTAFPRTRSQLHCDRCLI